MFTQPQSFRINESFVLFIQRLNSKPVLRLLDKISFRKYDLNDTKFYENISLGALTQILVLLMIN